MTKRRAIQILIDHASKNVAGVGCGMRPEIRGTEKEEVREAVQKLWSAAYDYELRDVDLYNRGLL